MIYVTPLSFKSFARPTFILTKICLIIENIALAYFAFSDNIFLLFFTRNICLISCSIYLCYFCRYIGLISPAGCREQSFAGDFPGRLFFDRQRRGQSKNNGRSPKIFRKKSKKSSGRNLKKVQEEIQQIIIISPTHCREHSFGGDFPAKIQYTICLTKNQKVCKGFA